MSTATTSPAAPPVVPGDAPRPALVLLRPPDPAGEELVARVASLAAGSPEHADAVARAVEHWSPMARRVAGAWRRRTSEPEDLEQVALTALVQAVLRYRPEVGAFPCYAVPCVRGEVRRWLRDVRGLVHVPRRVVELDVEVLHAQERLVGELGRLPSTAELACAVGVDAHDVLLSRAGRAARQTRPLDSPGVQGRTGREDGALDGVEDRAVVAPLLSSLDERSRTVLVLRYYGQRTQQEIATEIGVSQVQVSRILRRSLDRMRRLAG